MERVIGFALIFLLLIAFAGLGVSINHSNKEKARLIAQCIDDGRKEYECRSMLSNGLE